MTEKSAGYHVTDIPRGELGELSKVQEEMLEAIDAKTQGSELMVLIELADVLGAIDAYLERHHPSIRLDDLRKFSEITKRAFQNGHRQKK
jgi:phosphoribosyl-ATP pyrophosphohydrolase